MTSKHWSLTLLALCLVTLLLVASATAVVDPFFHYHKPLADLQYPLDNQRYQNDGIVRHFSYDALITGTSMTENFKTSELDAIFGVNSVKVSYSGGSFSEIIATIRQAAGANPDLKLVVLCLDEWFLFADGSLVQAEGGYPTYLYDENPFNDVNYLLNKQVLFEDTAGVLEYTAAGNTTTSFDDYGSWAHLSFGAEQVLDGYDRPPMAGLQEPLTETDAERMRSVFGDTLLLLAKEYPNIQFYCYFPPYSILDWDNTYRTGLLEQQLLGHKLLSEILLEADNIRLFSFVSDYETVTDLNNYRDIVHHNSQINTQILQSMKAGEYRLTKENYRQYWQEVGAFYRSHNYEAYFGGENDSQ